MCLSRSHRITSAIAALIASAVLVGGENTSVNPPLAKPEGGVAPVAPESIKVEPPKKKSQQPRGSAKIGRDPSGINREQ